MHLGLPVKRGGLEIRSSSLPAPCKTQAASLSHSHEVATAATTTAKKPRLRPSVLAPPSVGKLPGWCTPEEHPEPPFQRSGAGSIARKLL